MIDPDRPIDPAPEALAKVLPAGGPLVTTCWTCPACGYAKPGEPPKWCMSAYAPRLICGECPLDGRL